jgi:hypothetical protein
MIVGEAGMGGGWGGRGESEARNGKRYLAMKDGGYVLIFMFHACVSVFVLDLLSLIYGSNSRMYVYGG